MGTAIPADRIESDVLARASRVRMILLDSDGVLTDGRLIVGSGGEDVRSFDVKDGHGIRMAQQAGLTIGVLSGRRSAALEARAKELQLDEIHQGIHDKPALFERIVERREMPDEAVCFIGDDLIDLALMRRVGFAVAPADAVPEVLEAAHWVTTRNGGRGAVRETLDLILKATGKWDEVTRRYRG
jgi:3-deoxy-D-manno-octulosonate 8-phosphate phosphatase (KDO 8-P phosphatase)